MGFELHREPLFRRYYSPYSISGIIYALGFGFLLIFLPLIISYNSSSFWLKEGVVYEQPDLKYRYQVILEIQGHRGDAAVNIFYSTSNQINDLLSDHLRIPLIKSAELDDNRDGNVDRLEIGVQMPLFSEEQVTKFTALIYHDVELKSKARCLFDSVSLLSYDTSIPIGNLYVDGDIVVRQSWPLEVKGGYRVPYESNPLIKVSPTTSASELSVSNIMMRSAARNLSTVFQPSFMYSTPSSSKFSLNADGNKTVIGDYGINPSFFNASIVLRIPQQPIRYFPLASEVLKYAWIQYIAFFSIVAFLLLRLNSFILRHKLIHTYAVSDIAVEKMD